MMNENEPPNRSMPPQPALNDGGIKDTMLALITRLRETTEPAEMTPRRWPRWAVGAVALVIVPNIASISCWRSAWTVVGDRMKVKIKRMAAKAKTGFSE